MPQQMECLPKPRVRLHKRCDGVGRKGRFLKGPSTTGVVQRVSREVIDGKAQSQPWLPTVTKKSGTGSHKTETDGRPQEGKDIWLFNIPALPRWKDACNVSIYS